MYKKKNIIKQVVLLSALVFSSVLFTSCDNNNNNLVNIKVEGKGDIPSGIVHKNNGFTYSINFENKTAQIINCSSLEKYVSIPREIEYLGVKYPVSSIYEYAFNDDDNVETVTIPENVEDHSIYRDCNNLKFYNDPNRIVFHPNNFYDCINLESVLLNNNIKVIWGNAFYNCKSLCGFVFNEGLTQIKDYAFYNCDSLTSINIPSTLESIDFSSFDQCSSIETITVHEDNQIYDSRDNCNAIIESATNTLIRGCKNTIIPDSVTSIAPYAFTGCIGLEEIHIGKNITTIGGATFSNCPDIKTITVDEDNEIYDSRDNCNAIIETATNTLIRGCENTIIPGSVEILGRDSFSGCGFNKIVIPNNIISIKGNSFANCENLKNITLPTNNQFVEISEFLFSNCKNLEEIIIPDSVNKIKMLAFEYCINLKQILIPKNVSDIVSREASSSIIDTNPFRGCTNLETIKVDENNEYFDSRNNCNAIINTSTNELFIGCKNTKFIDGIESIYAYAFDRCGNLGDVVIPNSVKSIGKKAFIDVEIDDLYIPNCIIKLDLTNNSSFNLCNINSIKVSEDNEYYDSRDNCNALIETATNTMYLVSKKFKVPKSVTSLKITLKNNGDLNYLSLPANISECYLKIINCPNFAGVVADELIVNMLASDVGIIHYNRFPIYLNKQQNEIAVNESNSSVCMPLVYFKGEWEYVNKIPVPSK